MHKSSTSKTNSLLVLKRELGKYLIHELQDYEEIVGELNLSGLFFEKKTVVDSIRKITYFYFVLLCDSK